MNFLQRMVQIRPLEVGAALWSCAYFFFVLCGYYILRPIRDDMGIAGGVRNLPWLFTGTLLAMLLLNPAFSALVARLTRRRFIAWSYRFFMVCLGLFFLLFRYLPESSQIATGRAFYIWTAVFNLFVVSVFWGFAADTFRPEQGRRLFGFLGVGGTLGAICGSGIVALVAERLDPAWLMLVSIVLLELAVRCSRRAGEAARRASAATESADVADAASPNTPIGGGVLAGISHVFRSPYLLGICAYMLLYTILATLLYFQQASIVETAFADRGARTALFAKIDLTVNILTVLTQLFLTGRVIRLLGIGLTLALLPVICALGFTGLGIVPGLATIVLFQVLRRSSNYALARPAREVLYTVLPREDKFKAKNFIDTFVYRGGDQIGAWSWAFLGWAGVGVAGISFVAVPLALLWAVVAVWLGRKQQDMETAPGNQAPLTFLD
jgi:AAA family ATP:ADP antiporter